MPGALDVRVNASRINLKLDEMPEAVRAELLDVIVTEGGALADLARSRAQELLQVRTGKFVRRIRFGVRQRKNRITGRVYSSDPRAHLFEWGGHTKPHEIAPDGARALLLQVRGGSKFAARVHHPGGQYAARNIIHGAFDERKTGIQASMEAAVNSAVERVNE